MWKIANGLPVRNNLWMSLRISKHTRVRYLDDSGNIAEGRVYNTRTLKAGVRYRIYPTGYTYTGVIPHKYLVDIPVDRIISAGSYGTSSGGSDYYPWYGNMPKGTVVACNNRIRTEVGYRATYRDNIMVGVAGESERTNITIYTADGAVTMGRGSVIRAYNADYITFDPYTSSVEPDIPEIESPKFDSIPLEGMRIRNNTTINYYSNGVLKGSRVCKSWYTTTYGWSYGTISGDTVRMADIRRMKGRAHYGMYSSSSNLPAGTWAAASISKRTIGPDGIARHGKVEYRGQIVLTNGNMHLPNNSGESEVIRYYDIDYVYIFGGELLQYPGG